MSIDYDGMSPADLLRADIRETREAAEQYGWAPQTLNFALGQTYAGTVRGNPELEEVWQQETAPMQVELDLHLEGGSVDRHTTNARQFAAFVDGLNRANKEVVRTTTGHLGRDLLIEGASPGSVRVVLHADAPRLPASEGFPVEPGTHFQSSPDSEALREVARLMTMASDDESPAIAGDVRALSQKARTALTRAVKAIRTEDWEIAGTIRQRGLGTSPVRLTSRGATVLAIELAEHQWEERVDWIEGSIDGYRRSLGSFYFTPAGGGRPFAVSATSDLLARAAGLAADPDVNVRAQIQTVWAAEGETERLTTSRHLLDIRPAEIGVQADLLPEFVEYNDDFIEHSEERDEG